MSSERPLNIIHVNSELGFSGGEVQLFLLLEGLRQRGHHNLLITPPGSRSQAEAHARNIETRCVPMRHYVDAAACFRLRGTFRDAGADLVMRCEAIRAVTYS